MSIAFRLLSVLLATTPVLAFSDGAAVQDLFAIMTAVMLVVTAIAPANDITHTMRLLKGFSLAILFPMLFMLFQLLPMPFGSLVNPIWPSAATALNEPSMWGHVSLDPGNTLRALMRYLAVLSLMVATVVLTRDRQRAQTTLFILCAMTALMSVEAMLGQSSWFAGIFPVKGLVAASFVVSGALGTLANAAVVVMAIERHLTSQREVEISHLPFLMTLFLRLFGVAICLAETISLAPSNVIIATAFGLAIIVLVMVARRFAFYPWAIATAFALLVAIGIGIIDQHFRNNFLEGLLGLASATPEAVALARRLLSDSGWLGSGVGTFSSLTKLYQDFGAAPIADPPSTAIGIAVEWGRPALVLLIGFAIQLFVVTFLGALKRGRDWFFSATAAASVAVVLFEAFSDPSLKHLAVQTIVAVILGLGISQSIGRTSGLQS